MPSSTRTPTKTSIDVPRPQPKNLHDDYIIREILDYLNHNQLKFTKINFHELKDLLNNALEHRAERETTLRSFLRAFEETETYQNAKAELDVDTEQMLQNWLNGTSAKEVTSKGFNLPPSPAAKHHFSWLQNVKDLVHHLTQDSGISHVGTKSIDIDKLKKEMKNIPEIWEDTMEKVKVECYPNTNFTNWGLTVKNAPKWTFVPKSVLGVQNVVKFAKQNNMRVRCAGFRHSWSDTFSADEEILISLLNLDMATAVPSPLSIDPNEVLARQESGNELKTIELLSGSESSDGKTALCRVGVSVTNEQFRRWAVTNNQWTLPVDVILVEVTIGGVNGPICHGAGITHKTISDYVRRVEYIDANGEKQIISEPVELKAAAGCFGLLGVVTHITFALDKMVYALLQPVKVDVGLAIPPLDSHDVPLALRKPWTEEQLKKAKDEFFSRAANDYYSEWFWFTFQKQSWVNTWSTTTDGKSAVEYPSKGETFLQWVENWFGGVMTSDPFFQGLPPWWQAQLLATSGMVALPPNIFQECGNSTSEPIKTPLPNALHFRRGIQNMRVRDMEFQIPIPELEAGSGKPDFSIVQRAWWDVINLVYADKETPMRLTMEMRIMNGSDMIMAPQAGNKWTCSIEVLTIPDTVNDGEWERFTEEVKNLWVSYETMGLIPVGSVRPHWAKEWEKLTFSNGEGATLSARQYLKTVSYKDAIPKFRSTLASIGEKQGWKLDDLKARFSNEMWDEIIFD